MTKYTPELAESRPGNPDTVFSYNALGDFELILKSSLGGGGGLLNVQTFTSDGTYTPTAGTSSILIICTAGGGGTGNGGSAGGSSSFGAFCSATGGGGGGASGNAGTGGAASGGNINILGGGGGKSDSATGLTTPPQIVDEGGLMGGSSFWGGGGRSMRAPSGAGPAYATDPGRAYGSGAGGASERSSGGAGGTAIEYITSGFSSVPVTVGSGGAPADASGEAGANGIVVVLEYGDGGVGSITPDFDSGYQPIVFGAEDSYVHGLGSAPRSIEVILQCQVASNGWSIGDIIYLSGGDIIVDDTDPPDTFKNIGVGADDTTITAVIGSSAFVIPNKTGNASGIIAGNWNYRILAYGTL